MASPLRVTLHAEAHRPLTIGRDRVNDVVVAHPSVSRRHLEVVRQGNGQWLLRDLGSANGTFVRGSRVQTYWIDAPTVIRLGNAQGAAVELDLPAEQAVDGRPGKLVVEGLHVRRGQKDLLAGVNLVFPPGSLVAILGPSGAGKSTLVGALTGVVEPTAGRVLLDGIDVHTDFAAVRDRIGFVPQDDIVHPSLTVLQCLDQAAAIRMPLSDGSLERRLAVDRVLEQLGLTGHRNQRIDTLSGGQRKRVGTALELLSQPSLLVLDEPTSGLDPNTERQVMELLAGLSEQGHTVLVVTHSPLAVQACSRAVVVARGAIVYSGKASTLPAHFRARTLGTVFARVAEDDQGLWAEHWREVAKAFGPAGPPIVLRPPPPAKPSWATWRRQCATMMRRTGRLLIADRINLALLLLSAPLLGALVRILDAQGLAVQAAPNPHARNAVLAAVLCVVWLATFDGVREIVKERKIFERERRAGLTISAYVTGKAVVLSALVVVQTAMFVAVLLAGRALPTYQVIPGPGVELAVSLVLTGWCALAIALLVSAVATSSDKALALAPLLVVPQLVLAGALTDVSRDALLNWPTRLVTARWGLSASSASVDLPHIEGRFGDPGDWLGTAGTWATDVSGILGLTVAAVAALVLALRGRAKR